MTEAGDAAQSLRAALFVDFDNIYISFDNLDPEASRRFATQPARWLAWFETGAHACLEGAGLAVPRRILVRRCYLNPFQFGRYRSDFTRAAFSVVDCPPLTTRGKTSADIYMVMDVLDALEHPTRFDEFIILSSDADFTPVLLRLRAHDRRSTILCTDLAAAAYKAACDWIVPHDTFFTDALGIEEVAPQPPDPAWEAILPEVAARLREAVLAEGEIASGDLPQLFQRFPEFKNSHWFGYFSLRALAARLVELAPEIAFLNGAQGHWSLVASRRGGGAPPVSGRHEPAPLDGAPEDLARFIRRIAELTGAPALAPGAYAGLYQAIAEAVAEGYGNLADLTRAVCGRCAAREVPVTRAQASFLLTSFRYHGYRLERRCAADLAREWCRNVRILCESAQIELGPDDQGLLAAWLLGDVAPRREPEPDGAAAEP
jgi:hypothetical protein